MPTPVCPRCSRAFLLERFLESASGYSTATDSGASVCPECSESVEFRIRSGVLEVGFCYWAGAMHFEGVGSYRVRGLRLVRAHDTLTATVNGRIYPLSPPRDAAA